MMWPGAIEIAIETLNNTLFILEGEKKDIFYHNAARFLELSEEIIAGHQYQKSDDNKDKHH